ncbi:hypothetical protein ACFXD5_15510 [Streptomyces sp. NPDC059385]|uniref:hypothetical protein n=1 Tax=Streptomyces sp. NPDC059385 TaxID=3346817 RepID=UPI0036B6394A
MSTPVDLDPRLAAYRPHRLPGTQIRGYITKGYEAPDGSMLVLPDEDLAGASDRAADKPHALLIAPDHMGLHVHVGAPVQLTGEHRERTALARTAVTRAWRTAAAHLNEPAALAG